jgi:hypothetical protein
MDYNYRHQYMNPIMMLIYICILTLFGTFVNYLSLSFV